MYLNDVTANPDMKWYQVWWHVWTHPGAEAFRTILKDSQASAKRGFLWRAVTDTTSYLAYFFFGYLISGLISANTIIVLVRVLIGAPLLAILFLSISAGVYRFIAGLMGGSGTWDKLVYCFAAISAPASLLSIPSVFLAPFFTESSTTNSLLLPVGCLVSLIGFAAGIYTIVLFVSAIAAVENTGTGKAVLIYFTPVIIALIIVIAVSICWIIGVMPLTIFATE
jgi:hypothetical protein